MDSQEVERLFFRPPPASAAEVAARLAAIPLTEPWTPERAGRWWAVHAPATEARPIADLLLSHESRPPGRLGRRA